MPCRPPSWLALASTTPYAGTRAVDKPVAESPLKRALHRAFIKRSRVMSVKKPKTSCESYFQNLPSRLLGTGVSAGIAVSAVTVARHANAAVARRMLTSAARRAGEQTGGKLPADNTAAYDTRVGLKIRGREGSFWSLSG